MLSGASKQWMTALISVIGLFIVSLIFGVLGVFLGLLYQGS